MSTPVVDLIEHAKSKSRECCEQLIGPDDDIMPIMLFLGPYGIGFMPLGDIMQGDDAKDEGALRMTASLTVSRAVEAVMVTTAYMANLAKDDERVHIETDTVDVPIREMPERTEAVVLMCSNGERDSMIYAPITRYPDKPPTMGEWIDEAGDAGRMGGRFGKSINLGLKMSREMPSEMAEIVDEGWREGAADQLIERFIAVARNSFGPAGGGAHVEVVTNLPGESS